jgi:simple sugar transport system ATP-binding protein
VAFVSHKLREVLDIADRITVLRGGRVVGSLERGQATENELAALMIGRDLETADRERHAPMRRDIVLAASGLKAHRDDGAPALRSVTLEVCGGEIVGIAGVEGNGQLEFAECLYGLRPVSAGRITLRGSDITEASPPERRAMGMRYIPADRLREGLVLEFDAPENVLLGDQRRGTGMLLHLADARARAEAIAKEYALTRYRSEAPVAGYSGGMQQKLIVGRELSEDARAVIAYTPTRGVDVGAAETIARRLRAVRDAGAAVIVISYDLDEIRALSDRIIVFAGGRISGEADPNTATDAELGRLMGGLHDGA